MAVPARRRPWLLLDCDGVVAPLPPRDRPWREVPPGYRSWQRAVFDVYVHEELSGWAAELDRMFEVVWVTTWEDNVVTGVAVPAGLPSWPVLRLDTNLEAQRGRLGRKPGAVARLLAGDPRPYAWVDDHLGRRPPVPVAALGLPHLLVAPDPAIGLTAAHVERLVEFAATARRPATTRW